MAKKELKTKAAKAVEESKKFDWGLSQETTNSIWGIIAFGLAIVSTLAFIHHAGSAGDIFARFSTILFGWGIFLVPVASAMIGMAFFKSISRSVYASALVGTGLFVFSFLALFYISGTGNFDIGVYRGGYLGLVFGYPLLHFLGPIASFIILGVLMIIAILLALDISIASLLTRKQQEEILEGQAKKDSVVIKRGTEIITNEEPMAVVAKVPGRMLKSDKDDEREFVIKASKAGKWVLPPIDILYPDKDKPHSGDINANVGIIKKTLANFDIDVEMGEVSIGPTVTQYTLRPDDGVRLSKIEGLQKDLSLALAAHPLRVEAPIPGKALVGIEIPNKKPALVGLRDLIEADDYHESKSFLPLAIGRDVAGFPVVTALEKLPHLLIAGATGTGKSVVLNSILLSLLYRHSPDTLKLILVDPKRVELSLYNGIPHLITPVIVDSKKVVNALKWAVHEMEKRYDRLSQVGSRDIASFNAHQASAKQEPMPFIVIVIDELADLMAAHGRDVEGAIVRLAQMARAVGIHLIVSTQRPSVEVITGLIKANITSRIALQVASQIDSRTILDGAGAEKLIGRGDMLYQSADNGAKMRRIQGAFVGEKEVKDVVKFLKDQAAKLEGHAHEEKNALKMPTEDVVAETVAADFSDEGDDLFNEAKDVVAQAGKASASLLQRRLRVGYARAARLLDLLEEKGIIGPGEGAKPREVYIGQSKAYDDGSVAEAATALSSDLDDKIAIEE